MGEREFQLKAGWAGIVLTGWARYDHFAVLCELLPASLPSLAINLLILSQGGLANLSSLATTFYSAIGCEESPAVRPAELLPDLRSCWWPGAGVYRLARRVGEVRARVEEELASLETQQGWFTPYHVRHNSSQPFRVSEVLRQLETLLASVQQTLAMVEPQLGPVFSSSTIEEWREQSRLPSLQARLSQLRGEAWRLVRAWQPPPPPPPPPQSGQISSVTSPTPAPTRGKYQRKVQAPDYYSNKRQWRT